MFSVQGYSKFTHLVNHVVNQHTSRKMEVYAIWVSSLAWLNRYGFKNNLLPLKHVIIYQKNQPTIHKKRFDIDTTTIGVL
jgi:hypothetical protein